MRFALPLPLLIALQILATPVAGQDIRSPYRFIDEGNAAGVYVGYFIGEPGNPGIGPHSSPLIGARFAARITGPLSAEFNLSIAPNEREVIAFDTIGGQIQPTGEMVDLNLLLIEGGLKFHLTGPRTWRGLAPYVLGTGGLASNLAGVTEADSRLPADQQFRFGQAIVVGVGVGSDLYVGERFSLRLEARDHILRLRVPAGLAQTQRAQPIWTNNFGLTLGAALHF